MFFTPPVREVGLTVSGGILIRVKREATPLGGLPLRSGYEHGGVFSSGFFPMKKLFTLWHRCFLCLGESLASFEHVLGAWNARGSESVSRHVYDRLGDPL